jgi:hypothetical protein
MKNTKNMSVIMLLSAAFMVSNSVLAAKVPDGVQPELESSTECVSPAEPITVYQMQRELESLQQNTEGNGEYDPSLPVVVVVDQNAHHTHVLQYQHDDIVDVLCVQNSTGKTKTPTPNGRAVITMKESNPSWKPPKSIDPQQRVVPPFCQTHKNPLGPANLRLSLDHGMIALHGTNEPKQIGKFVSHGCVRHLNSDILRIAKIVKVGTPVYIVPTIAVAPLQLADFVDADRTAPAVMPTEVVQDASGITRRIAATHETPRKS